MEATLKLSAYFQIMQKTAFHHGYGDYVFIIKDNGIGMTPEFVNHIFEPFERESSATISGIEGTGLGMAITKNIVEMNRTQWGQRIKYKLCLLYTSPSPRDTR